jgi:pyrroline-5-carboxylate reductase
MTSPILLIGAGRMGGALLHGWARHKLGPVIAVEPTPSDELKAFAKKHHVALFAKTTAISSLRARACVVALKPQILKSELAALAPIAQSGALMLSIAAGTGIKSMKAAWGQGARIVRAMPNTPGAIGRGITALYADSGATRADHSLAGKLLDALGETVWVEREADIDAVTAVSGSGPAYVFLMVEALAEKLARATITGAGALLAAEPTPPEALRRAVTSPKGTTEAALKILMRSNGLSALMRRAVAAARARARELGS